MPFHKGFLGLRGIDAMDGLARVGQPQREQVASDGLARQPDPDIGEVDLGLLAGQMDLRDHARQVTAPFQRLCFDLRAPDHHVVADSGVRRLVEPVFLCKTLMNPAGCVPLLARRGRILQQHRVDPRLGRLQDRGPRRWLLPRRRDR